MNTPVSFELAKLLKEKGFNEPCYHYYYNNKLESSSKDNWNALNGYSAPTIVDVVIWLYEKYGIWTTVTSISQESWQCHMTKKGDSLGKCYLEDFYTPTEAYEAAVEYTLQNLVP